MSFPMTLGQPRWIFDLGAETYAWLTWQEVWRGHCRTLVDHFPASTAQPRVLDLGVGPGVSAIGILDRLPDARVTGVDFSPRMLRVARRYLARSGKDVALVQADAARLPFADDTFDVATGHSFLYLTPDPAAILREAGRVVRPGGACVFLEPSADAPRLGWLRVHGPPRFHVSMLLWRAFSGRMGRFDRHTLAALLSRELCDVEVSPTLGGLGLLGRGIVG
jgi:ubiquinone/menaquinone biosynthesis C-methylase UbiE